MQKKIHIVSFDVPFQPNYGGVMDVYLRARALKEAGFYVVIHAFEYGRGKLQLDEKICDEVFYYSRKGSLSSLSRKPYIVNSRKNSQLLERLLAADGPILLEGQHCTSFVHHLERAGKIFAIRMHNVEWQYYRELANKADTVLKKTYYRTESRRLRHHEHHLFKSTLLCISEEDQKYYSDKGVRTKLVYPPLFFDKVTTETKNYALFHGNLAVVENIEAVNRILEECRSSEKHPEIVFAGKNPSEELRSEIENAGFKCFSNPSSEEMDALIGGARVHLCIGFQRSGLKLKLLKALETGNMVIATNEVLHGAGVDQFCVEWDGESSLVDLMDAVSEMDQNAKENRVKALKEVFSPKKYVELIEELLFRK